MLSKYAHLYQINQEIYAYYNSLYLKPVYFDLKEKEQIENYIKNGVEISEDMINILKENKIIVNDEEDLDLLECAKNQFLIPYPTIAYFILSEKCNLSCKYCFLGNGKKDIHLKQMNMMTEEIANKAVEYYALQTKSHPEWFEHSKEIIFYGGEPLMNFEILKFIISKFEELQKNKQITQELHYSMVTNGLLLDEDKILYLKEKGVATSISIDGFDEKSNENRIDRNGKPIFDRLTNILNLIKKMDWNVGLSITLTDRTIRNQMGIFELLKMYGIDAVSFNLLYSTPEYQVSDDYYEKASEFIIEFFKKARKCGIYEDRINRKIDAFVNSKLYLSDCAATSGSQIVVLPDGRVGLCHGCIENKEYFFTSVDDKNSIEKYDLVNKWSRISPILNGKCQDCEALGICGGGCPINAQRITGDSVFSAIDTNFCVHAKKTLEFMIKDLYSIISTECPLE